MTRGRVGLLQVLIELGADLESVDRNGQTALASAMLRGEKAAVASLRAAGAAPPVSREASSTIDREAIGASVRGLTPILLVKDVGETLRWYVAAGFRETGRYPPHGETVYWGMVSMGGASIMFESGRADGASAMLLLTTDGIQDQYAAFKSRQLAAVQSGFGSEQANVHRIDFVDDLHEPPFGGLRFSIRDCNGYTLQFLQERKSGGGDSR